MKSIKNLMNTTNKTEKPQPSYTFDSIEDLLKKVSSIINEFDEMVNESERCKSESKPCNNTPNLNTIPRFKSKSCGQTSNTPRVAQKIFVDVEPRTGMRIRLLSKKRSNQAGDGEVWDITYVDSNLIKLSRGDDENNMFYAMSHRTFINNFVGYVVSDTKSIKEQTCRNPFNTVNECSHQCTCKHDIKKHSPSFCSEYEGKTGEYTTINVKGETKIYPVFTLQNPYIFYKNYNGKVRDVLEKRWNDMLAGKKCYWFVYGSDLCALTINADNMAMSVSIKIADKVYTATSRPNIELGDEWDFLTGVKICLTKLIACKSYCFMMESKELASTLDCLIPEGIDLSNRERVDRYLSEYLNRIGKRVSKNAIKID